MVFQAARPPRRPPNNTAREGSSQILPFARYQLSDPAVVLTNTHDQSPRRDEPNTTAGTLQNAPRHGYISELEICVFLHDGERVPNSLTPDSGRNTPLRIVLSIPTQHQGLRIPNCTPKPPHARGPSTTHLHPHNTLACKEVRHRRRERAGNALAVGAV